MNNNINKSIEILEKNIIKEHEFIFDENSPLAKLNYEQQIAATRLDGNYLVIAGPGSGKTHTIIYRVLYLLSQGTHPSEICIITFTRKAANELVNRLAHYLPDTKLGFVGTFHALANNILLKGGYFKNYRLIDPEDDAMLLKLSIDETGLKPVAKIKMKTLQKIFSYVANTRCSVEDAIIKLGYEQYLNESELFEKINENYANYKKRSMVLNYDDILSIIAFKGLTEDAELENVAEFKYLMIDEYQDTNNLQIQFIKQIHTQNVMAIGDDFQSIYGFRGANNAIILGFANDFANAKMIKLKINYRSTPEIVDAINLVTKDSVLGYHKELVSALPVSNQEVVLPEQSYKYAEIILEEIKADLSKSHAVLYRASAMRGEVEKLLIKEKLSYVVYGGVRLLERKHIKDVMAIMLTTMSKNDLVSYLRSLLLIEKVGEKTAKKIMHDPNFMPPGIHSKSQLQGLNKIIFKSYDNPAALLDDVIKYYKTLPKVIIESNYKEEEIIADFKILKEMAEEYVSLTNFINDVILDSSFNKVANNVHDGKITLSTIHSAKGLEFDNVYYIYGLDFYSKFNESNLEENRRMFYVAISRAKSKLMIFDQTNSNRNLEQIITDFSLRQMSSVHANPQPLPNLGITRKTAVDLDNLVMKKVESPNAEQFDTHIKTNEEKELSDNIETNEEPIREKSTPVENSNQTTIIDSDVQKEVTTLDEQELKSIEVEKEIDDKNKVNSKPIENSNVNAHEKKSLFLKFTKKITRK